MIKNPYSPFNSIIGDGGKAYRELKSECFVESFINSYEGALSSINAYFCKIEEDFIKERSTVDFPGTYDNFILQVYRNSAAGQLILKAKTQYHHFIRARSKMPVELPPVEKSEMELWLDEIVKRGVKNVA